MEEHLKNLKSQIHNYFESFLYSESYRNRLEEFNRQWIVARGSGRSFIDVNNNEIGDDEDRNRNNNNDGMIDENNNAVDDETMIFAKTIKRNIKEQEIQRDQVTMGASIEKTMFPIFNVAVPVDLTIVCNFSYELFDLFMTNPNSAQSLMQDYIYCSLKLFANQKQQFSDNNEIHIDQVHVPLIMQSYLAIEQIPNRYLLKSFNAVLYKHSAIRKVTRTSVWTCSYFACTNKLVATLRDNKKICSRPVCSSCKREMIELINQRDLIDSIVAEVIPTKALRGCQFRNINSTKILLEGQFCDNLKLGEEYELIGTQELTFFRVWGLTPIKSSINFDPMPLRSRNCTDGQSCRFTINLASLICNRFYNKNSYLHLKIGLLLSLVSLTNCNKNNQPMSILAIGEDTLIMKRLMLSAAGFANRFVHFVHDEISLNGRVSADGLCEAGFLTMAQNGICLIDDWMLKENSKHFAIVKSSLESGKIMMNNTKAVTMNITSSSDLKTAVWTYLEIPNALQAIKKIKSLIDIFGIAFVAASTTESQIPANYDEKHTELLDEHEMQIFLRNLPNNTVEFNDHAEQLIKNYFVATRFSRQNTLPIKAVQSIRVLSAANAKLNGKNVVDIEDVLFVIWLFETALESFYGPMILCPFPPNLFTDTSKVCNDLGSLQEWLRKYVDQFKEVN